MDLKEKKIEEEQLPITPERLEGESFEDYKRRMRIVNKAIKTYRKGKLIWISKNLKDIGNNETNWGTFNRKKVEEQLKKQDETK